MQKGDGTQSAERRRISSHEDLVGIGADLEARLSKDRTFALLVMLDPLRALSDAGYEFTPSMERHVKVRLREMGMLCADRRSYDRAKAGELDIPSVQTVTFRGGAKGRRD